MKKFLLSVLVLISTVAFGGTVFGMFFVSSSPPVLTLIDWWDPTTGVTTDVNGITSIDNQVGGGPQAVQATAGLEPQSAALVTDGDGTSALNGITFDGVDDRLEVTLPAGNVTTFMIMAFVVAADVSAGPPIYGMVDGSVAPLLELGSTSGKYRVLLTPGGTVAQSGGTSITTGSAFALGMSYDGTTLRVARYNGSGPGSSTSANVKLTGGDIFYIGGAPTFTSFNGQMGDIQIYKNWSGSAADLVTQLNTFWNTTDSKYFP